MKEENKAYSGVMIAANKVCLSKGVQHHSLKGVVVEYEDVASRLTMDLDIADPSRQEVVRRIRDAVWDTGATSSNISERTAREMGLQPVDTGMLITAIGAKEVPIYMVDVLISKGVVIRNLRVFGSPMKNRDVEFIIGMDIISRGKLIIDSTKGRTTVDFTMQEA